MTQAELLKILQDNKIDYQYFEHPPVFTVEEAQQYSANIPGIHVKNLFLRNKKKTAYALVTTLEIKRVNLKMLSDELALGKLSFASRDDVIEFLGVMPGSVTPLAILNAPDDIQLFLDEDLLKHEHIAIHPMVNTATITLQLQELMDFIVKYRGVDIKFLPIVEEA